MLLNHFPTIDSSTPDRRGVMEESYRHLIKVATLTPELFFKEVFEVTTLSKKNIAEKLIPVSLAESIYLPNESEFVGRLNNLHIQLLIYTNKDAIITYLLPNTKRIELEAMLRISSLRGTSVLRPKLEEMYANPCFVLNLSASLQIDLLSVSNLVNTFSLDETINQLESTYEEKVNTYNIEGNIDLPFGNIIKARYPGIKINDVLVNLDTLFSTNEFFYNLPKNLCKIPLAWALGIKHGGDISKLFDITPNTAREYIFNFIKFTDKLQIQGEDMYFHIAKLSLDLLIDVGLLIPVIDSQIIDTFFNIIKTSSQSNATYNWLEIFRRMSLGETIESVLISTKIPDTTFKGKDGINKYLKKFGIDSNRSYGSHEAYLRFSLMLSFLRDEGAFDKLEVEA